METATYKVYVDWDNNDNFTGTYDDISAYVLDWSYRAGRSSDTDHDSAGTITVQLDNSTGIFSPFNTTSPIYGKILPNRKVKVTMAIGAGAEVTQRCGFIERIEPIVQAKVTVNTAVLTAYDALAQFNQSNVDVAQATSITTGGVIDDLLDGDSWPAGDRSIEAGLTTLNKWWIKNTTSRLSCMRQMQDTEFGRLLVLNDGKVAFYNRDHYFTSPEDTPQATYGDGTLRIWNLKQEDSVGNIYNSYRASISTLDKTDVIELASIVDIVNGRGGEPLYIGPGESLTVWIRPSGGYQGVATWNITYLEANTASDGSGTDVTTDITATKTAYGSQLKVVLTNGGGAGAYIIVLTQTGSGYVEGDPIEVRSDDATSQSIYRIRQWPGDSTWLTNVPVAQSHGNHAVALYKNPRARITFDIKANYDAAHLADVQAREIGQRIHVTALADFGLYIDEDFIIDSISRKVDSLRLDTMTITCTIAPTVQLAADYSGGNTYTSVVVNDYTPPVNAPADLTVYGYPVGGEADTGCTAKEYNENITAAEFVYKFVPAGSELLYEDLSAETPIALTATFLGANYNVPAASPYVAGRIYFAYRLYNGAWSLWSDGNPSPTRVTHYVGLEDSSLADDGPPEGWEIAAEYGTSTNSVIIRPTRPPIHGRRIISIAYQIRDISGAEPWRDLDSNAGAAVTLYDGAAVSHTLSADGFRLTLNAGAGFGTSTIDDLLLIDRRQGAFDVHYTIHAQIGSFEGDDAATATYLNLRGPLLLEPNADYRIRIVKRPWTWNTEGYFGGVLANNGWVSVTYYDVINADGSNGDMSSEAFESPEIYIGTADIANIRACAYFQTGYSCSNGSIYTDRAPTDGNVDETDNEDQSPEVPVDIDVAGGNCCTLYRVFFNTDGMLGNLVNSSDGRIVRFCLVNTSDSDIAITLDTKYRNGLAFPIHGVTGSPATSGLDIVDEVASPASLILEIAPNSQGYLTVSHDSLQDKHDILSWTYNYGNADVVAAFPDAWAYWKMEETSGTRVDSSGNSRDLALTADEVSYTTGKLGNCLVLPTTAGASPYDMLTYAGNPDLSGDAKFTISFWFYFHSESAGHSYAYIDLGSADGDGGVGLTFHRALGATNVHITATVYALQAVTGAMVTPDAWHFITVYYDQVGLYIDVDNANEASALGTSEIPADSGTIQFSTISENLTWRFDEVGYWVGANALSATQRTQLYNSGSGWSPY